MTSLYYTITLESDLIVSARSGTEGGHECLDYLPGSLLLGALASQPGWFDPAQVYRGNYSLGNAYPVTKPGAPISVPVPLTFHTRKEDKDNQLVNALKQDIGALKDGNGNTVQPKQMRDGFVDADKHSIRVKTGHRMKTAIDRKEGGRSAESQLFEYSSLNSGQSFCGQIDCIDAATAADIRERLEKRPIRMGRSRSAEYGQVLIRFSDSPPPGLDMLQPGSESSTQPIFYCVSDLALTSYGQPRLIPEAADFGLNAEQWEVNWTKSFIRTRSYSPWVAIRNGWDNERQVIVAGSVIAFKARTGSESKLAPSEAQRIREQLDSGIGSYRLEGLGRVVLDPKLLGWDGEPLPKWEPGSEVDESPSIALTDPADLRLFALVQSRSKEDTLRQEAERAAPNLCKNISDLARKIEKEADAKFSRSQWNQVRQMLSNELPQTSDNSKKLQGLLKSQLGHGIRSALWANTKVRFDGGETSMLHYLCKQIDGDQPALKVLTLRLAVNQLIRDLQKPSKTR